jgi:MutS domain V
MASLTDEELVRPSHFYARRSDELRVAADESAARYSTYTQFLIVLGLLACVAFYLSVFAKRLPFWSAIMIIPAGALVVQQRHRCHLRSVQLCSLIEYYDKGAARLARKWDLLDSGDGFIDQDHFYSRDLDLFGQGSLYQLLCSARTHIARETLAHWMKAPAKREEIHARHEAISELRPRRELPELLAAAGPMQVSDFRPEFFKAWVAETSSRFPIWAPLVAFLLALAVIILPILYWSGFLGLQTLWVSLGALLFTEGVFAVAFRGRVKSVLESLGTLSIELPTMHELLQIIEREQFSSSRLKTLAKHLGQDRSAASGHIRRLLRFIRLVEQRKNEWFAYPSFCLLWGTQFAMAIERWRRTYGAQMLEWIAVLGEIEALISLSTYSYEHPGDTFPELVEKAPVFDAEGLAHPLLEESTCVRNDLILGDTVRFLIVSGSNMSGKSTFLRAIGLNAVLAYMGAPVRCTKLRLSSLTIGAAVRMQDSVVDGRSHFLAEMERLRRMIEEADHGPLLFLADEIMGGTNSHDRRIATEWVIKALMLRGAIGAITTHDLALTEIAANGLPGRNVCFEDSGEFGSLSFDYRLRQGILSRSNALNIAHLLGIDAAAERH